MGITCRYCGSSQVAVQDSFITSGLCASCTEGILSTQDNTQRFINSFAEPILFVRNNPRKVVAANQTASQVFGRDLTQFQGLRGGQVFGCVHSFSDPARGPDPGCQTCKIKKAIKETLAHHKSSTRIYTLLDVLRQSEIITYHLELSTEPIGDHALVRVDRYSQAD